MTKKHNSDSIIEEIHRTRQQFADKFGNDIGAILDDARKRQAASGRAIWRGRLSAKQTQLSDSSANRR
jgi:hypothetical protein